MTTNDQSDLSTRQRRAIGWIVNLGLVWALGMAWCGQRWPEFSRYFLAAAALGAIAAMGSAALQAQRRSAEEEKNECVDQPEVKKENILPSPPSRPSSPLEERHSASRDDVYRYLFKREQALYHHTHARHLTTLLKATNDTGQIIKALELMELMANREAAYDLRQRVYDLRAVVGNQYTLNFGTVQVEIDGDNANVILSGARSVTLKGAALKSALEAKPSSVEFAPESKEREFYN